MKRRSAERVLSSLGQWQITVRSAEDHHVERRWLFAIGQEPQAPPHPQRIDDDDAFLAADQDFDGGTRIVGLAASRRAEKAQAIIERRGGDGVRHGRHSRETILQPVKRR
jgi:hypothetical protein